MATFEQAIIWAHEGHKIKRTSMRKKYSYFHIIDGRLVDEDGDLPLLTLASFDAKDWIIHNNSEKKDNDKFAPNPKL